jgi:hypothetical protein
MSVPPGLIFFPGLAAVLILFATAGTAICAEVEMDVEHGEREVARLADAVLALAETPAQADLKTSIAALYAQSKSLAAHYQKILIEKHPEIADFLRNRRENTNTVFAEAPVVLYGSATEEQVYAKWREQLRAAARGIAGIARNEPEFSNEFMYWADFQGKNTPALPFVRMEQIRDCSKELQTLHALLTLPKKIIRVTRGETIVSDAFSDLQGWTCYGKGEFTATEKRMRVAGEGITVWCNQVLGECIVSLDYTPASAENKNAGALFAFPGSPVPGKDMEISAGPMDQYNVGINTYHCSLFRGNSGKTNLRRTGPGLKMLSTVKPDACAELNKTYKLEFVKYGASMQVFVDGKLIHAYVDAGTYGPCLMQGQFGMRHFANGALEAYYANFKATAVKVE